jgi:2-phospho-L-lactate transferase/gluconeogenesis factor (CofD/UPF0052 family)
LRILTEWSLLAEATAWARHVSLSSLGSRLTGIVTTTDNGGSTGRIRRAEGGIAWGDMRNCLNQFRLLAERRVGDV